MDEITQKATQMVEEDIKESLKGNLDKLKASASVFLKAIKEHIETSDKVSSDIKSSNYNLQTIYSAMKQETETTQFLVAKQFEFEKAVNNFFGRTIALIWVNPKDGKIYYADEIVAAEIYKKGTKKNEGRAGVSVTPQNFKKNEDQASALVMPNEFSESFQNFIGELKEFGTRIITHQENYKAIYNEVTDRWEANTHPKNPSENSWYNACIETTNKNGETSKNYLYRRTFYWKGEGGQIPGQPYLGWSHSRKMNRGNISEAYIDILMSDDKKVLEIRKNDISEDSVKQYWFYMKNHKILNNISGIVQGDVILAGKESLQFAVKEGSFNTAAIGPYIVTAFSVLAINDENKITVKEILHNLPKLEWAIKKQADILAQDEISKIVENTLRPKKQS